MSRSSAPSPATSVACVKQFPLIPVHVRQQGGWAASYRVRHALRPWGTSEDAGCDRHHVHEGNCTELRCRIVCVLHCVQVHVHRHPLAHSLHHVTKHSTIGPVVFLLYASHRMHPAPQPFATHKDATPTQTCPGTQRIMSRR